MSYDVTYTNRRNRKFKLDKPLKSGGTQEVGGNTTTWLNVTYNYTWYYFSYLDKKEGIRWLDGRTGGNCITRLEQAIKVCPMSLVNPDYFVNTPGNCKAPLKILIKWCKKWPKGVFHVK